MRVSICQSGSQGLAIIQKNKPELERLYKDENLWNQSFEPYLSKKAGEVINKQAAYVLLKMAYHTGFKTAYDKAGFSKLAITLRGLHGTSGIFDELILRFGGALKGIREVNPPGVYASTVNPAGAVAVRNFARQAVAKRGGEPWKALLKIDTNRGWRPSGFTQSAREGLSKQLGLSNVPPVEMRELMEDHVQGLISQADVLKTHLRGRIVEGVKRLELKRQLGDLHKETNQTVGSWYNPDVVKSIGWKPA
jgi:hypothetical protein